MLEYQRLISWFFVASNIDLREMIEEIAQTKEKLVERMDRSEELNMSWWRPFMDVSLLQGKKGGCQEDKIVVEELFLLQSRVPDVQR